MDERSCWDDVLGTMPETTLAVRRAAFRRLLSGHPVDLETVADEAGLSIEDAREAVDLVVSGWRRWMTGRSWGWTGSRREGHVTA